MHIRVHVTSQWRHKVGSLVKFSHKNQGSTKSKNQNQNQCQCQNQNANCWSKSTTGNNSGTITARDNLQKRIDFSWNTLSLMCPQIWPKVNSLGSRGHQRSMTFITSKKFFAYISGTKKDTNFLRTPSCSSHRDASDEVWHYLERSSLRLTSGQGQVKVKEGHFAYHMTRLDETNIMVLFVFC